MRISDWSSDVCSSDLPRNRVEALRMPRHQQQGGIGVAAQQFAMRRQQQLILAFMCTRGDPDRPRAQTFSQCAAERDLRGRQLLVELDVAHHADTRRAELAEACGIGLALRGAMRSIGAGTTREAGDFRIRSDKRRVGKELARTGKLWWSPYGYKK